MGADPFIGQIQTMGFNFNPRGWFLCSGSLLAISQYSTLFSLLGTFYGGDGRTTFALPELRGRTPVAKGRHPGSYYDWRMGQQFGDEAHTMTVLQMPSHAHGASFSATTTGTVSAEILATTDEAESAGPVEGSYLASVKEVGAGGHDLIYKSSPSSSSLVSLGGATASLTNLKGNVTVTPNGGGQAFSILQPGLVVNYCLANVGVYPPRS